MNVAAVSLPLDPEQGGGKSKGMKRIFLLLLTFSAWGLQIQAEQTTAPSSSGKKPFVRPVVVPSFGEPASGRLGWEQAVSYCLEQKSRLPTVEELKLAFQNGLLKTWEQQGDYWTLSDDADQSIAYSFITKFGLPHAESKGHGNLVRCIKPD